MSGRVGDLSPSQERDLAEFRRSLSDVLKPKHDDYLLLQFLRARRFDLKKSEDMLRKHLLWRETFDEDYLVDEYDPPEVLRRHLSMNFLGYDKSGCPIRLIHVGAIDLRGVTSCFRTNEILKFISWFLDTDKRNLMKRNKETGVYVETRNFIYDMKNLSLWQMTKRESIELMLAFVKHYESNYPENLKIAYIINAPSFFTWMYSLVKPLLSEDTINKLRIHGSSGWQEDLLKEIDPDILPVTYGGTRTDPDGDPKCLTFAALAGPVPTCYYMKNQPRLSEEDADVQKVLIANRSRVHIPLGVDVLGCVLNWEVYCKNCDIRLGLVYHDDANQMHCIIEPIKIGSDYGVEKGRYLAEKRGKYSLVLDNTHSLLKSKAVLYRTSISHS